MALRQIELGETGIIVPQNCFGCLPLQRISKSKAVDLLRRSYHGGMRFFDTARAYSDSEEKVGSAFERIRAKVFISTKTHARTPEGLRQDLATSLEKLKTDYIDLYQLHCVSKCYKPGDGTGLYDAHTDAKKSGKVRHYGSSS